MIPQEYISGARQRTGWQLQSGDPGYDQLLVIENGLIDLRPGVVAMCVDAQHVITANKFAVEHDMAFRGPRSYFQSQTPRLPGAFIN